MRAHQIMTKQVFTTTEDASIVDVANLMLAKRISGLPVVDAAGNLVGIVSQGDFLRRAEIGTQRKRGRWLSFFVGPVGAAADFIHDHGRKVGEIMTHNPVTVTEDTVLADIVRLMEVKRINRLPVMRQDALVGIVTRSNLLQAVAGLARDVPDPTADDDHIRNRIFAAIEKADWAPFGLGLTVRGGIVELSGTATSEEAWKAINVAAENVSGVVKVHNHLGWIDAYSGMIFDTDEDRRAIKVH